jgi:hypothetical protein
MGSIGDVEQDHDTAGGTGNGMAADWDNQSVAVFRERKDLWHPARQQRIDVK